MATTTLYMTSFGTPSGLTWSGNASDIDEPLGSYDSQGIYTSNNPIGTQPLNITDVPADFYRMTSLSLNMRFIRGPFITLTDTDILYLSIVSGGITYVSEITLATSPAGGVAQTITSQALTLTSSGLAATASEWNAATVVLRCDHTNVMSADNSYWNIDVFNIVANYNRLVVPSLISPSDTGTVTSITPELTFSADSPSDVHFRLDICDNNVFGVGDSCSVTNTVTYYWLYGGYGCFAGFTSVGGPINSLKVTFVRNGTPAGNIVVGIYTHVGTWGGDSTPGSLLTSVTVPAANILAGTYTFEFTTPYTVAAGEHLMWMIYGTGGSSSSNSLGIQKRQDTGAYHAGAAGIRYQNGTYFSYYMQDDINFAIEQGNYRVELSSDSLTADSYTGSGYMNNINNASYGVCQTFYANPVAITGCKFMVGKTGSPTGSMYAKLYCLSDPTSYSARPLVVLATSDAIAVSSLGTTAVETTFTFSTPWTPRRTGVYAIALEYSSGDASNYIRAYSNSPGGHSGTFYTLNTTGVWSSTTGDLYFVIVQQSASTGFYRSGDTAPFTPNTTVSFNVPTRFGLEDTKTYYWKIAASEVGGNQFWTAVRSFSINAQVIKNVTSAVSCASTVKDSVAATRAHALSAAIASASFLDNTVFATTAKSVSTFVACASTIKDLVTGELHGIPAFSSISCASSIKDLVTGELHGIPVNSAIGCASALSDITAYVSLGQVILTSPSDTSQQTRPITFTWQDFAGQPAYQIQIATDQSFQNIAIDEVIFSTSFVANTLACGTTYYWRVRAMRYS